MRKYINIFLLLACVLCSCDVIREGDRLIELPPDTVPTTPDTTRIDTGQVLRTHVLIDFTGFRCVNCPTAAETAAGLLDLYGERLIVVAMHPASNPFTKGKYDYTCPAADAYYQLCGGNAQTPFPVGNIDLQAQEGTYLIDPVQWAGELLKRRNDSSAIRIEMTAGYSAVTRELSIHPTLRGDTAGVQMVYWLVEDSVKGVQAMPDGSVNMEYYHRHLLRAALTDTAGYNLPETCDAAHCAVVAVAQDKTYQHILQAKQFHLNTLQE